MRGYILCCCLIFFIGCASHITRGKDNFIKENYTSAFPDLLQASKEGDREAQYAVGYMYYYGNGINENKRLALYWIKRSADAGYLPAQQALSLMKN